MPRPDHDRARRPLLHLRPRQSDSLTQQQRACTSRHQAPSNGRSSRSPRHRRAAHPTTPPHRRAAHPATAAPPQGGQEAGARHLGAGGFAGPPSRGARDLGEREGHLRARPHDLEAHVQSHKSRRVVGGQRTSGQGAVSCVWSGKSIAALYPHFASPSTFPPLLEPEPALPALLPTSPPPSSQ